MKHTKFMTAAIGLAFAGAFAVNAQAADMPTFTIVNDAIPASLTGKPGDAAAGRKVVINRKKGNCLACHLMPIPEEQFHGHVGPDLAGVAKRMDEATLRMRVVNPKVLNADTMMPSFFTTGQHRVRKDYVGKTILSAQDVEDVVAYLKTLM
jgi:sulfur-oxidizing protein SoxX